MSATDPHPEAGEVSPVEIGTPEGRRAIECLWNPQPAPPGRGPRPRTNLAEVVDAGVAIADVEGVLGLLAMDGAVAQDERGWLRVSSAV